MRSGNPRRLAGWLALVSLASILTATLSPWLGIAPQRIPAAWCLVCGGAWAMDAVSNVLLFMPLGAALMAAGWPPWRTLLLATGLSFGVELLQAHGIPPSRSPSVSDLLTNVTGSVLGMVIVRQWHVLHRPSPVMARRLAGTATVCVAMTWCLTAASLRPRDPAADARASLRVSRFDYAPGYGWYGGRLGAVTINDQPFAHDGEGPVVLEADRGPATFALTTTLRGRDTLWYTRAMVFVHARRDTVPEMALSQHGDHLELHIERRGTDWGLMMPYVRLADALDGRTATDSTLLRIAATASTGRLALSLTGPQGTSDAVLDLTPTIGWTMLQSVVGASDPLAPAVHLLWLLVLVVPIGWWSGHAPTPRRTALRAALVLTVTLMSSAWWAALSMPGVVDWSALGVLLGGSAWWAARSRAVARTGYIAT